MQKVALFIFVCASTLLLGYADDKANGFLSSPLVSSTVEKKSQHEKRDSQAQTGIYNNGHQSSNDEPFRPMYHPYYFKEQNDQPTSTTYTTAQAVPPQSQTYYNKPQTTNNIGYPTNHATDTSIVKSVQTMENTGAKQAGPVFTSNGVPIAHYGPGAPYRGPFVYQKQQQPHVKFYQQSQQKPTTVVKTSMQPKPEINGPVQPNLIYSKPNANVATHTKEQSSKVQLNLIPQQVHQPHHRFYSTYQHQQPLVQPQPFHARALPQQHHIQYIIAIPLSHLRQMQSQQAHYGGHYGFPTTTDIQASTHPLIRHHYGSYGQLHPSHQHITPDQQSPQYATQYIQLPSNILHAAVQAAHGLQHQSKPEAHTPTSQLKTALQQTQPQYFYQSGGADGQHHQIKNEQPNPQTYGTKIKSNNESVKPINKNQPIYATPTTLPEKNEAAIPPISPPLPNVVHYNPIYVQGPPPEQQQLFSSLNYHRFANGGFPPPTPIPFVQLSPATHAHGHVYPYTQLIPHQPNIQHPHFFQTTEQAPKIVNDGLTYFTHPGGVNFGPNLYHHTPKYIAPPSKPENAASDLTVGNQQSKHTQA